MGAQTGPGNRGDQVWVGGMSIRFRPPSLTDLTVPAVSDRAIPRVSARQQNPPEDWPCI